MSELEFIETDVGPIPVERLVDIVIETDRRHKVYYRDPSTGKVRSGCVRLVLLRRRVKLMRRERAKLRALYREALAEAQHCQRDGGP
ncbi:MAG: hypothetical protein ACREUL_18630 [Steroidobacteraceae bacterium]